MRKIALNIIVITLLSFFLFSCSTNSQTNTDNEKKVAQAEIYNTKGYELLKTKCYICHFEKPDPDKADKMIAPPMMRIKEHYLPNYPNKEDFINAVVAIVKNPSEEKTLMPGAVKKFKLMPKLIYTDEELKLIAETIYNLDFGTAPKLRMLASDLQLNNGEKWIVKPETYAIIKEVDLKLSNFKSDNVADYNQLGKDVFDKAKYVLLDSSYTGELFNQLHIFFNGIENDMHALIAEKDLEKAKKTAKNLKIKIEDFYLIFKAE